MIAWHFDEMEIVAKKPSPKCCRKAGLSPAGQVLSGPRISSDIAPLSMGILSALSCLASDLLPAKGKIGGGDLLVLRTDFLKGRMPICGGFEGSKMPCQRSPQSLNSPRDSVTSVAKTLTKWMLLGL